MEKGSASSDPLAKPSGVTVADAGDAKEQVQEREETTPGMAYLEALNAEAVAELGDQQGPWAPLWHCET
jgi:hypothetical protein